MAVINHHLIRQFITEMMRLDPEGVAIAALARLGDMAESEQEWDSAEAAELKSRIMAAGSLPGHIVDDAIDTACEVHTYIEQLRLMDADDNSGIDDALDGLEELLDDLESRLM